MFTNPRRQEERTGKYGTPRLQYLQAFSFSTLSFPLVLLSGIWVDASFSLLTCRNWFLNFRTQQMKVWKWLLPSLCFVSKIACSKFSGGVGMQIPIAISNVSQFPEFIAIILDKLSEVLYIFLPPIVSYQPSCILITFCCL